MNDSLDAPLCLPPRPLRNPAGIKLPKGTCDTHFHVFAEGAPLTNPRSYTPRMETIEGWSAVAGSFGIETGVLIQPSVYGLDNSVLLQTLATRPHQLRGIVVIAPETGDIELRRMDALGVRGVRVNLRNKSGIGFQALKDLAPRIRSLGWHVQFQIGPDDIDSVVELTARYGIVGVIDHLAFMSLETPAPALGAMERALGSGRVYSKISAPYRLHDRSNNAGYRQVIFRLAHNFPERLLWASDWPHTELFDSVPEDDDLVALSLEALPIETHTNVFATNAKSLYFGH